MNSVPQRRRPGLHLTARAILVAVVTAALVLVGAPSTVARADEVAIPDAELRKCIQVSLDYAHLPSDFGAANLAKLPLLVCSSIRNGDIADLTGIDSLTGASLIMLLNTSATDLTALARLTDLKKLALRDSSLTDATALTSLSSLTALQLYAPLVTSYRFALGHPSLTQADFKIPLADDLAELAALPALTNLTLTSPTPTARTALADLTALQTLTLVASGADGLDGLAIPSGVTKLTLAGSALTDLSGLEPSNAHASLTLDGGQVMNLAGIDQLPHLTQFTAQAANLRDISALAEHPDLTSLDLSKTAVSDVSALATLPQLKTLSLASTPTSDLGPLTNLAAMESLDVSSSKVADLAPLSGHNNLRTLDFSTTKVSDLRPLTGIPLTSLTARSLGLTNIAPLTGLGPHAQVRLEDNHLKDFSPLPDDAEVSIGIQTLPNYPVATVGKGFDLGLRAANGQPLCPTPPVGVGCTKGAVTYPRSGTYITERGSFTFTQYAGPNRKFSYTGPKLQFAPVIGSDIGVLSARWKPAPSSETIQWYRDGVAVSQSASPPSYYRITAADVGHRLKACRTASLDGFDTVKACTAPTIVIRPGLFGNIPFTRVAGTKRAGRTVTAVATGPWEEGSKRHYQWYRDNKKIKGATSKSYRLTKADRGHRIKVRIKATKPGYTTVYRYSPRYRVR